MCKYHKRLESDLNERNSIKEDLERSKLEIITLRRLLAGKDALLRKLNGYVERSILAEIEENDDDSQPISRISCTETNETDGKSESLLETLLSQESKKETRRSRPKTATDNKLDMTKPKKIRIKSAPQRPNAQRICLPNSPYEQLGILNPPPGAKPNPARSPPLTSRLLRTDRERLKFIKVGDKVTANISNKTG